jgi:hypothetical protein
VKPRSEYDLETGRFTGRRFLCPARAVEANTLEGCGAVEGRFDPRTHRVDVEALADAGDDAHPEDFVVSYERPAAEVEAEQRDVAARAARRKVDELEQHEQPRAVREALLELLPENSQARRRLLEIEAEIADRRPALRRS